MTLAALRHTPLHDEHVALGGRMVPFAGWHMPVQYAGVIEEHTAVRTHAGVFDVSHMLRVRLAGPGAANLLRWALTYNAHALDIGKGHYGLICEPDGGILDDVFLYRLADGDYLFVGNASNAEVDYGRLTERIVPGAVVTSLHEETSMLALQGPKAIEIAARLAPPAAVAMPARACIRTTLAGRDAVLARTGYTGEDGFEIIVAATDVVAVWRALLDAGVVPCGLGARDTLRLEAALPLYGNDIDTTTNPYEAGLGFAVDLDDGAGFVGRAALMELSEIVPGRKLVCLQADERGIIRHGHPMLHEGEIVGSVSSGTFSPTLQVSIGMAYVPRRLTAPGTELLVDVRGRMLRARVVPRPFYRRPK